MAMQKYKCKICDFSCKHRIKFKDHVNTCHKMELLVYWRTYDVMDENAGKCIICHRDLNINRFVYPYGFNVKTHAGKCSACTLENFKARYGIDAERRWNEYCKRQSETNTLEYKSKMYGMTKTEFDEYNKSRAVTEENLIRKYGEDEGKQRFHKYCEKQKYVGCAEEYFIEKYGMEEGKKKFKLVNRQKSHSIDYYIEKYGKIDGERKFKEFLEKSSYKCCHSKTADNFFLDLSNKYISEKLYFGKKEFGKMFNDNGKFRYFFYDFVDTNKKKIIEFNGDYWHPKAEHDENWEADKHRGLTSEVAWDYDRKKEICAKQNGFKIFYIWEHEVKENYNLAIEKCLNFLKE